MTRLGRSARLGWAVCAAVFVGFTLAIWRLRGANDAGWYACCAAIGVAWIAGIQPWIKRRAIRRRRGGLQ